MELVMNTSNARVLATSFGERSERAVALQKQLLAQLTAAAMDDTHGVGGSLIALSDELHTGDLVLRHQADIMDGLTVDVDAIAAELGVERWKVEKKLKGVEGGWVDPGEALISIVDWADYTVLGFDTTIRKYLPDLPPRGEDAEIDALIQRLDGWLLSKIIDGKSATAGRYNFGSGELMTNLSAERLADLRALADLTGIPDPATIQIEETYVAIHRERGFRNSGDDNEKRTIETRFVELPEDQHQGWMVDQLVEKLTSGRKIARIGTVPQLGELFDLTMKTVTYTRWEGNTDDGKEVERTKEVQRTPAEINELIAEFNARYADIGWLPAVLAGLQEPPPQYTNDPGIQALVRGYASEFGYRDDIPVAGTAAMADPITFLKTTNVLANAIETPRPAQKARITFADNALDSSIAFGERTGVLTEQTKADASVIALHLSGLDPNIDPATIDAEALAAEAPELDIEELARVIAASVPPHQLSELRMTQAVTYVQRAATVEQRIAAVQRALLGLTVGTSAGEAAMTKSDWLNTLPPQLHTKEFDTDIDGEQFEWLRTHVGVPGYHKSPDFARRGKRYIHLVNEADGTFDQFVLEVIPKKKSWFARWGPTIFKAVITIVVPVAGVVFAAMDAAIAASEGDWVNAAIYAAGALAAGAGMAATAGTAMATAARAAQFVNAGLRAGVAFARGDELGGIINSVAAVGAGASTFGLENVGANLTSAANVIRGVDATIDAIKGDDIAAAIAGGLTAGSALVDLSSGLGDFSKGTSAQLERVANSGEHLAKAVRAGGAVVDGIRGEEWGAVVGAGLRFGAVATDFLTDDTGAVAGAISDNPESDVVRTLPNGQKVSSWDSFENVLNSVADLADSGVAFANGDELGGVAALSGGVNGLLTEGGVESVTAERLDAIAGIADGLAAAGPDADMAAIMAAAGEDINRLSSTLRTSPDDAMLRPGDPAEVQQEIAAEQEALADQRALMDELASYTPDDALVAGVLGGVSARLSDELAVLNEEQRLAGAAVTRQRLLEKHFAPAGGAGFIIGGATPPSEAERNVLAGHSAAGPTHPDALKLVEVNPNPHADDSEVIIVIGGFADDSWIHSDGKRPVGDQLVAEVQRENTDARVAYIPWNNDEFAAEWLEDYKTLHPDAEVTIVGHSYGGDAALDLAARLGETPVNLVTLDPVSHDVPDTPDNVTRWDNISAKGFHDYTDFVAFLGGHWGHSPDAENSVAHGVSHGDVLGLFRAYGKQSPGVELGSSVGGPATGPVTTMPAGSESLPAVPMRRPEPLPAVPMRRPESLSGDRLGRLGRTLPGALTPEQQDLLVQLGRAEEQAANRLPMQTDANFEIDLPIGPAEDRQATDRFESRRVIETATGQRYVATARGNGLVEFDYGVEKEVLDRLSIQGAADHLHNQLKVVRGEQRITVERKLREVEMLLELAEAPPAPGPREDFEQESFMVERVRNVTAGRLRTASNDPNEYDLIGAELGLGPIELRSGVSKGDIDPDGVFFTGTAAEAQLGNLKLQGVGAEFLAGTVIHDQTEISGLNIGAFTRGIKWDSSVDEPGNGMSLGGGWAPGRFAAGIVRERSDKNGDGRLDTTVNLNMGPVNFNGSGSARDTYLQGLVPGSRPSPVDRETGYLIRPDPSRRIIPPIKVGPIQFGDPDRP